MIETVLDSLGRRLIKFQTVDEFLSFCAEEDEKNPHLIRLVWYGPGWYEVD